MTATTSRAPSAQPASAARHIQKRRDKPYKTEQSRVIARKRKLDLHTTYTKAPEGFQFLPVGTPDLADRCKEISRLRGLPVNVVNAKPVSKHAVDPEKVSHHIHRIGYHFRSDVVDDACQELGYVHVHGNFVKESDLAAQNENTRMARALARFGLSWDVPTTGQETNEKVRAAIKELFPRMPEADLKAILEHAWAEGSDRVGTNATIELPRRVQLATIARIRHTYTDYDRLLRAFEWSEARALVEPTCLQKLIEWRGENEDEDDNELEEIVRETIVIDDDDDQNNMPQRGSEADDEVSSGDVDQGYASDTSLEISHKPAAVEDLGAESHDERSRRFLDRHHLQHRNVQQRYLDVRQKIGLARQQMRDAHQPSVVRVHVPQSPTDDGTIMIDGQLYRRAPYSTEPQRTPTYYSPLRPPPQRLVAGQPHVLPHSLPESPRRNEPIWNRALQDQPIASIEPRDDLRRNVASSGSAGHVRAQSNGSRPRPTSPEQDIHGKRRRLDSHSQNRATQPTASTKPNAGIPFIGQAAVPESRSHQGVSYTPDGPAVYNSHVAPQMNSSKDPRPQPNGHLVTSQPASRHGFVDAQVAPIQYVPIVTRQYTSRAPPDRHVAYSSGDHSRAIPQVVYVNQPQPGYPYQTQPVHGAPAPVQPAPITVPASYPSNLPLQYPAQPRYYYPG